MWPAVGACGVKVGPKPLSVREWQCAECGIVHDRAENAARNIRKLGVAAGRTETENAREIGRAHV